MNLAVLDYGLGNMYSVYRALDKLGVSFRICTEGTEISPNETVMLPGVGSFGEGMRNLRASGQADALTAHHREGGRIIGVCLGAQMLLESSAEAKGISGLGFVKGSCKLMQIGEAKVPVQDWQQVEFNASFGFESKQSSYYYFSHSFAMFPERAESISAVVRHNNHDYAACIREKNVIGIQFHPEKSGPAGLKFLKWTIREGFER